MIELLETTLFCWVNAGSVWLSILYFIFTAIITTICFEAVIKFFENMFESVAHTIRGFPQVKNFYYSSVEKKFKPEETEED